MEFLLKRKRFKDNIPYFQTKSDTLVLLHFLFLWVANMQGIWDLYRGNIQKKFNFS